MLIKRIKITNYKTYKDLDLDLSLKPNDGTGDRPIILIGGNNGDGKTTLFEAICGALYGLPVSKMNRKSFCELVNASLENREKQKIVLELTFTGYVLDQEQTYVISRTYMLSPSNQNQVVEAVRFNLQGSIFSYGTANEKARNQDRIFINQIINANLPQMLSQYFLFDAMQAANMLKEEQFSKVIRDNVAGVMGFNKYKQLENVSRQLLQAKTQARLEAESQAKAYANLCQERTDKEKENDALSAQAEAHYTYLNSMEEAYRHAKDGQNTDEMVKRQMDNLQKQIEGIQTQKSQYVTDLKSCISSMEATIFMPEIVENLRPQLNAIIKAKNDLKTAQQGHYTQSELRQLVLQITEYMRISGWSQGANVDQIVEHLMASQSPADTTDPYAYLTAEETEALKAILLTQSANNFPVLNNTRNSLNHSLSQLPTLNAQHQQFKNSLVGDDNALLIQKYEQSKKEVGEIEEHIKNNKQRIEELDSQIQEFDVQVQQEPDIQYDTLKKLEPLFQNITNTLLHQKREQIETQMAELLNKFLLPYKDCIKRVEMSEQMDRDFYIKMYHIAGNEISLSQLNAASKQIFIQVLLKVLRDLGDYTPPIMIDTVMGVLDKESRSVILEEYFPKLAHQVILLCTPSEIDEDSYQRLRPHLSKTYTLHRIPQDQTTTFEPGYFTQPLEDA